MEDSTFNRLADNAVAQIREALTGVPQEERRVIAFAWMLKTQLYLLNETSHKWTEKGKRLFSVQIEKLNEHQKERSV
jgi:hypothetical protein